ncbi:Serine/threonine-protein phosphatase 2A 55 kDa regulatory subunit B beta isoform [Galdieria sulphuraria]|nr:Serine/threonine-protein phosphatase 2A 55 kDa regulatory subunit B beta isoform [Galdieria sulphuraria]
MNFDNCFSNNKWKFPLQNFESERDCDFITSLAFDPTGEFLAVGDKSGRVAVLKRNIKSHGTRNNYTDGSSFTNFEQRMEPKVLIDNVSQEEQHADGSLGYYLWADFQSHEPEFDYLKSLEIEEKINEIQWCRPSAMNQLLLTTNDKTIKLWKLREKSLNVAASYRSSESHLENFSDNIWNGTRLSPVSCFTNKRGDSRRTCTVIARTKNIYCNAHAYHINSISLNSDGETFLSSDDLRINIWNLEIPLKAFNVVDIKPEAMEDLNEVITSAKCHPCHCHLFIHSSSKGIVRLCDLRSSALCDRSALDFEQPDLATNSSFFSEIISSISDVRFSPSGEYILARDYMHLLLWDIRMSNEPLLKVPVHDYIRSYLCELYENDFIFDKFRCSFSHDGKLLFTGSYDNKVVFCNTMNGATMNHSIEKGFTRNSFGVFHPSQKILEVASHPLENVIATAAGAYVYLHRGY